MGDEKEGAPVVLILWQVNLLYSKDLKQGLKKAV
jgi:hypothetical protein